MNQSSCNTEEIDVIPITMITSMLARKKAKEKKEKGEEKDNTKATEASKKTKQTKKTAKPQTAQTKKKTEKPKTPAQLARAKKNEEREATKQEGKNMGDKWGWEKSWAKEILRTAISNGDITLAHTYDEIHSWHTEVEATDRKKLPGRVCGLRDQVSADKKAADSDEIALLHDRALYPTPTENFRGEPRWQGSEAEKKLKEDIAAGVHLTMTPAEFASLSIFDDYPESIIRQHIYQEVKFQKYCLYRNEKKASTFVKFSSK